MCHDVNDHLQEKLSHSDERQVTICTEEEVMGYFLDDNSNNGGPDEQVTEQRVITALCYPYRREAIQVHLLCENFGRRHLKLQTYRSPI